MEGMVKRKAINELRAEIALKESVVEASKEIYARTIKESMGKEIKKNLPKNNNKTTKNLWTKVKDNFKKILNQT